MPDEQIKRVAGYAWFMNNPPPTPEQLYRFMMRYLSESGRKEFEFIKLVTDYGRPKSLSKRIGWNQVLEMKRLGLIDMVCIPSMRSLSENPSEPLAIARELSCGPNPVETLFMYEDIISSSPEFDVAMTFHLTLEDYSRELRKKGRELRKLFMEAQLSDVLP